MIPRLLKLLKKNASERSAGMEEKKHAIDVKLSVAAAIMDSLRKLDFSRNRRQETIPNYEPERRHAH